MSVDVILLLLVGHRLLSRPIIAVTTFSSQSETFEMSELDNCLTDIRFTLSNPRSVYKSSAAHCALHCRLQTGCSMYLFCENYSKNCLLIKALGIYDVTSKYKQCSCYKKTHSKCENGGFWKDGRCKCLDGFYGDKCEMIFEGRETCMISGSRMRFCQSGTLTCQT